MDVSKLKQQAIARSKDSVRSRLSSQGGAPSFAGADLKTGLKDTLQGVASDVLGLGGKLMAAPLCRFFVDVAGMGESALSVENFESRDLGLSSLGRITVNVLARVSPDTGGLIGKPARLRLASPSGTDCVYALLVERIDSLADSPEGARLRLHLVSPMAVLTQQRHNRVFLNKQLDEVIEQVMVAAGIEVDQLDIELSSPQPARELVVQYEESDFDFLQRQLAREGAFFTVQSGASGPRFLFRDDSQAMQDELGAARLAYHRESGQSNSEEKIVQISDQQQWLPTAISMHDYNPDCPDRLPEGSCRSEAAGDGDEAYWAPHASDSQQAQALASIRLQSLDAARQQLRAKADTGQLQPGMQLQINGHARYSGAWLVVAVVVQGDQRVGHAFGQNSDRPGLQSELTLVPAKLPWRSAQPWRRAPVQGSFHARIEGDGSDYAYLDDQGRYRIRLPFDLGGSAEGEASPPVRLMQPYGGPESGLHLPLHAGTEVAVSWLNGDVDRPFIMGALSNPATPTPVTGANPSQHILRTRGGNELLMEDRAGEERIELFSADRKNRLALDAKNEAHQVTLESVDGDMRLSAGGHMTTEVGGSQHTSVEEEQTITVVKDIKMMTQEGEITLQAGTDLLCKAADHINLVAENGDLSVRAGEDLRIRSDGDTSLEVVNGDTRIITAAGNLGIDVSGAVTLRGLGNGSIRIGQGGGNIEITPSGDLIIDGSAVNISGGTIVIDGQQIGGN